MSDGRMTRRRFVGSSAALVGSAMLPPGAWGQQPSAAGDEFTWNPIPSSNGDCVGEPVPVSISIAAGEPVRVMRGGIGASFHAIGKQLPGLRPTGASWSGSTWGGNPEADDDRRWEQLCRHGDWLGIDWCKVEIEQRMYEPEKRVFTWDTPEMRVLYRFLDWAERRKIDIFLQQAWADVAWNAYPGNADDPVRRLRSAPYSVTELAYGAGELLDHLVKTKGYNCIRWFTMLSEPGSDDFSWWQNSEMKSAPFTPGLKAVREEFDRRGIQVPLSGPDWTDLPKLHPAKIDFDPYIGAYDLHSYMAVFDSMSGGYTLAEAERRMTEWTAWAHARNKPFFVSEFGTMGFGWGHVDGGPACYQSGLKNASLVVRGIHAGVDGFNRWSLTNRGDLDGQWQLLRTWDVARNRLLDTFTPQPNAYHQYGILSRFVSKYSGVLATTVKGPFLPEDRKLVATALRSRKGALTVLVVNESYQAVDLNVELEGLSGPVRLHRYAVTSAAENRCRVDLGPQQHGMVERGMLDVIPPLSIVAYSSYRLEMDDPGIVEG